MPYNKIFPLGGSTPSGIAGAIQFSNGSAFASDATNLFWDDTNNRLGVGTNAPTHTLELVSGVGLLPLKLTTGNGFFRTTYQNNSFSGTFDFSSNYFSLPANNLMINSGGSNLNSTLGIRGSGSTSATTSLLVQNSAGTTALTVKDNLFIEGLSSLNQLNFRFGPTNQGISTRNGDFTIGLSSSTLIEGGRFYANGTGYFWMDGYTDGASKAQNYPMIFGSRAAAQGFSVGSYTTQENGSQSYFGFYVDQPSAQVIVNSTTRGFLPPRMTTTQKNAIATPAAGLVVYDNTTNKLCCYNGSTWNDLF